MGYNGIFGDNALGIFDSHRYVTMEDGQPRVVTQPAFAPSGLGAKITNIRARCHTPEENAQAVQGVLRNCRSLSSNPAAYGRCVQQANALAAQLQYYARCCRAMHVPYGGSIDLDEEFRCLRPSRPLPPPRPMGASGMGGCGCR